MCPTKVSLKENNRNVPKRTVIIALPQNGKFYRVKNYVGEEYLIIEKYINKILLSNESKLKMKRKISCFHGGKKYMCAQGKKMEDKH